MFAKSRVFVFLSISFVAGIFLVSLFSISPRVIYLALGVFISCLAVSFSLSNRVGYWGIIACACACAALAGMLRMQYARVQSEFSQVFNVKQSWEGYIVEDSDVRTDKQLLTVQVKNHTQNILVTTSLGQKYRYGDWVVVEGKILEPGNFDDFDYKNYLERFNVYGVVRYPHILVLKNNQGNWVKEQLLSLKHSFVSRMGTFLPEPFGSLLAGILIGAKKTLPQNIVDDFNTTGLSHVVAVSGFNITIIISSLGFLAYYLGRRTSFVVSLGVILGFVIISGASASVVRAGVMGLLILASSQVGRLYSITPSLCAAAVFMLIGNPKILFYDIGFQLSFAATMGIVYFAPLLDSLTAHWHDITNFLEFRSILIATSSAILFTLPLILYYFGRLSLVAPLANIVVLPTVPAIMFFGFFIAMPFVGAGFAFVARLLMTYLLWVISHLSRWPHAAVSLKISGWYVLLLSVLIIGMYVLLWNMVNKRGALRKSLVDKNVKVW
jgi:competence protein ComEC